MSEVFANGVGWVEVPEVPPEEPERGCDLWTPFEQRVLDALKDEYPMERIAWALGRTLRAVRTRARKAA